MLNIFMLLLCSSVPLFSMELPVISAPPPEQWLKAAREGDAIACYWMGVCCEDRRIELQGNEADPRYWYSRAEELPEALYKLGYLYERRKSYRQAFNCYCKGIRKYDVCCYYRLGLLYEKNSGIEEQEVKTDQQRYERAAHCYQEVTRELGTFYHPIDEGYKKNILYCKINAFYRLALLCEKQLVDLPFDLAERFYLEAIKLDEKHADALCGLGRFYEAKQEFAKAEDNYDKATKLQSAEGAYLLVQLYYKQKNYKGIQERRIEVMNLGNPDIYYFYGSLLENGEVYERNMPEALKLYKNGALRGSQRALGRLEELDKNDNNSDAQYILGQLYEAQNSTELMVSYYTKAAFNNHPGALDALDTWYNQVTSQNEQTIQAFLFYSMLGKQGYGKADYKAAELQKAGLITPTVTARNILYCYEKARDLYQDALKAERWWHSDNQEEKAQAQKKLQEILDILQELKQFKEPDLYNILYLQIKELFTAGRQPCPLFILYQMGVLAELLRSRYTERIQKIYYYTIVPAIQKLTESGALNEARFIIKESLMMLENEEFAKEPFNLKTEQVRITTLFRNLIQNYQAQK